MQYVILFMEYLYNRCSYSVYYDTLCLIDRLDLMIFSGYVDLKVRCSSTAPVLSCLWELLNSLRCYSNPKTWQR